MEVRPGTDPRRVGRYVLHDEIAAGGMGAVHLGHLEGPSGFSRIVAIKRLHPLLGREPELVRMFLDEARLAASVRHPNVVPTFDTIETDGEVLIVMEYVHGESLARLLKVSHERGDRIDPQIASAILSGMLYGLHAAHEATSARGEPLGIVHRDVSPANVLVGVDGVARVVDFGVAKAAGRLQTTRDGSIKGKISYMAPEQLGSRPVDRRSDVWAAGVVLWETLTCRRLFGASDHGQLVASVLYGEITAPDRLVADLPPGLNSVAMRALAREPSDRFPTARAMGAALLAACPAAAPHHVGEWVEACAHEQLAARAARISQLQSGVIDDRGADEPKPPRHATATAATVPAGPIAVPVAGAPRPRRRLRPMIAAAGVIAAAALGMTGLALKGAGTASPSASAATPPRPIADIPAPPPQPAPAPTATTPAAPRPPATTPAPPPVHHAAPSVHHAAPRRTVDCDPPYTRDGEGHKIWKRPCFQAKP